MTNCLMDTSKRDTEALQLHNIDLYNSDKIRTVECYAFSVGTCCTHTGKLVRIRTYSAEKCMDFEAKTEH
jgi:hypothetical protein